MTATPSWQQILDLLKEWSDSGLESASLQVGDFSFQVSRSAAAPSPAAVAPTPAVGTPAPKPEALPDAPGTAVPAPMIGVFYRSPAPGKPPYVEAGDVVDDATTIGLIEVMKLMCPVVAGVAGTVLAFDVADGQQVEFGQTLARVEPS